jgi:hypothetical protein
VVAAPAVAEAPAAAGVPAAVVDLVAAMGAAPDAVARMVAAL